MEIGVMGASVIETRVIESDQDYITIRIIDACLRENLFGLLDHSDIVQELPVQVQDWANKIVSKHWLKIKVREGSAYLPVKPSVYMQPWQAADSTWLVLNTNGGRVYKGYRQWLSLLAQDQDEQTRITFAQYCEEADTAVEHRGLCLRAYREQNGMLTRSIKALGHWSARMLFSDQVASYLDHPYYPTARAKFGFDEQQMRQFAPEFAPEFLLRWVAVECQLVLNSGEQPDCWPQPSQVGLPESMAQSHVLFPVHPATWESLLEDQQGLVKAPLALLSVSPTLSVRTVATTADPRIHIKLPLTLRTLGARNVRFIKPSTIYDGHLFSLILQTLEKHDKHLSGRYVHCDEEHGAHVGDSQQLAYIVREYPDHWHKSCALVPVAALASSMPDGRLYLQHLIDEYYQGDTDRWLSEYLDILLSVHLRLWLCYGIALEANQQNAVLVFDHKNSLTLVMKDNDSARLWPHRLLDAVPALTQTLEKIQDSRILVADDMPLAQMFCTITLQLNIAAIFEAMANAGMAQRSQLYDQLRYHLLAQLDRLSSEGVATAVAREVLFADKLYVKYLMTAGSLLNKKQSGAADINKYYGLTAPNFINGNKEGSL